MNFDLVDYEELEPIAYFSIKVIEYFKNDFIVIGDFLKGSSPWDQNIMWYLKLSEEELINNKKEMLTMIIKVYYDIIERPVLEQLDEEHVIANIVDLPFFTLIGNGKDRVQAFFQDERVLVIMLRVYVAVLQEQYNLNVDTAKYFNVDLCILINFYEELAYKYKLNSNDVNEKNFKNFSRELVITMEDYLSKNFRTKEEFKQFINYFFSIIYAYTKKKEKRSNKLIDNDTKDYFEDLDADLEYLFCKYFDLRYYLVMTLYDIYLENGPNFDFRFELDDPQSKELFSARDINFNKEKFPDIIVDNYTLDIKLERLINELIAHSEEDIYTMLVGKESIYNFLYYVGLDARYSEYYKKKIIRKILCDSYTYEKYLQSTKDNYQEQIVTELDGITSDEESYVNYFKNNYKKIFDIYKEFNKLNNYIKEQVYLYIYNSNQVKSVNTINDFTMIYYLEIMIGKIKRLQSVDCMNYYINTINNYDFDSDRIKLDYSKYGLDNLIRILCLNVYENIICLYEMSDKMIISKDIERIKQVIEQVYNITDFTLGNQYFFISLVQLFIFFNKENITYKEEITKRKCLEKGKNVLKRLNPYDEI